MTDARLSCTKQRTTVALVRIRRIARRGPAESIPNRFLVSACFEARSRHALRALLTTRRREVSVRRRPCADARASERHAKMTRLSSRVRNSNSAEWARAA
eukprot:scaffold16444_cov29-Tisochrysis_lutea.AAC.4